MEKFSIYQSLSYAAYTYRRHFFLSLSVGATLGFFSWIGVMAPRLVAQSLGVYKSDIVIKQKQNYVSKNQAIISQIGLIARLSSFAFLRKASEYTKDTSSAYLISIFLVWIISLLFIFYLYVGFLRFVFEIKAFDTSLYTTLFRGFPYFLRYVFASSVYTIFILCLVIAVLAVALGVGSVVSGLFFYFVSHQVLRVMFQQILVLLFTTIALMVFVSYSMQYIFYGYCLVEKDCTVQESFSCSKTLVKGSRLRLIPLFLVMVGLFYLYTNVIGLFTGYSGFHDKVDLNVWSFIHSVSKGFAKPFGGYMLMYVYKKLAD